ncbi:hypothetical protein [Chamaesiphon sp.]|uniref:hypothetical protein n=1 Tax=Chamaesiphon sp. TaxID=2814140 RepID=UPI003593A197
MNQLKAIVFDLDDTIYPERDFVLNGFRAVAAWASVNLGISESIGAATLFQLYREGVRNNTFDRWLIIHGIATEIVPELLDIYRQHLPNISPFPEAIDLLKPTFRTSIFTTNT